MNRFGAIVAATAFAVLASGLAGRPAAAQAAPEIAGNYRLAGNTADGTAYLGSLSLSRSGKGFVVQWIAPNAPVRHGFALRLGAVLGIAAEDHDPDFGVVLYRVKDGHLDGIWKGIRDRTTETLGREVLDGAPGLDGRFKITLGENPDGSAYVGSVTIRKTGAVYLVDWATPAPSFFGTGVLLGDVFVVGYSRTSRSGVAAYCLRPAAAEGMTAAAGDGATGAEILWRPAAATPPDIAARLAQLRTGGAGDCVDPVAAVAPAARSTVLAAAGTR